MYQIHHRAGTPGAHTDPERALASGGWYERAISRNLQTKRVWERARWAPKVQGGLNCLTATSRARSTFPGSHTPTFVMRRKSQVADLGDQFDWGVASRRPGEAFSHSQRLNIVTRQDSADERGSHGVRWVSWRGVWLQARIRRHNGRLASRGPGGGQGAHRLAMWRVRP